MFKVHFLSRKEVEKLLGINEALEAVEKAFKLQVEGKSIMPPKLYLDLPDYQGDFRAMPAYIDGTAGIKWVSVYPNNRGHNSPTVMATIILCDANTGCPLAVMDGTHITNMRTGAAGGVAVKYLARKDSAVIGMIGGGMQARTQLLAINEVRPRIEEVKVFDQRRDVSLRCVEEMVAKLNINIRPVETIEEATEADIVVTTTPSTKPIIKKDYIRPGTHINAIGADAPGKQELEAAVLKGTKIVIDDFTQASHSGEINVPLSKSLMGVENIYSTLGEIVANHKKGRENNEEITLFDSTGLAIQDIMCGKLVYEKAKEKQIQGLELL